MGCMLYNTMIDKHVEIIMKIITSFGTLFNKITGMCGRNMPMNSRLSRIVNLTDQSVEQNNTMGCMVYEMMTIEHVEIIMKIFTSFGSLLNNIMGIYGSNMPMNSRLSRLVN